MAVERPTNKNERENRLRLAFASLWKGTKQAREIVLLSVLIYGVAYIRDDLTSALMSAALATLIVSLYARR